VIPLLVDYAEARPGAKELQTSRVPIAGGPEQFYRKPGFEATGVGITGKR